MEFCLAGSALECEGDAADARLMNWSTACLQQAGLYGITDGERKIIEGS
jgi:hypothetical protein